MATDFHREPAKIYAFPARGRLAASGSVVRPMTAEEFAAQRIVATDFGEHWYHDAAIEDARDAKR
jgi:hypothetical protein